MKRGAELIHDIDACSLRRGELGLWWLGQHSFVVKLGAAIIYIDPFLTPMKGRLIPPLLSPTDLAHADLILGTHDHADHIDRPAWPSIADAAPKAKFVVPDLLKERLSQELKIPLERFIGLDDGPLIGAAGAGVSNSWTHDFGAVRVYGVAAAHEFLDQDRASGRYPHLGYIVEGNGCTLYHSGDCCIYEGLQTTLLRWKIDVVMLPINGRDAERLARGCIGNMTYQEAADLAGALEPRCTIPAHFDMFEGNLGDPIAFADYMRVKYPKLRVHVPVHGERCVVEARKTE
ncbi:MAG TPA: MBL fold metallo-hydrolase [Planctomycetota bacterium]|jgi:L-ascorbate metabolism protein UlaG (beta-lactamase superfamily)